MGKTIYIEATNGISGDMFTAALIDLGADQNVLNEALARINAKGFTTNISRVKKSGIDCCDFDVILDEEHDGHDHDMEYLYGESHEHHHHHDHSHDHSHEHHHDHEHHHEHTHEHHHHHEHRGLPEIIEIIKGAKLTKGAEDLAIKIFDILADAEAKAHGRPKDEVHFHEVGAIDSIVDIIAAAVCFDNLGIEKVIIPSLSEGQGSVRCQHGILPIPVPAVVNIVQNSTLKLKITNRNGEMVTPTGAAIAAAIKTDDNLPEDGMTINRVGIGAGKRNYEWPCFLRIMDIT